MEHAIAELFKQHREIMSVIDEIENILDLPCQPDIPDLFRLRYKLARLCKAHFTDEQKKVFEPLRQTGGDKQIPDFNRFPKVTRELWLDFSAHTNRWDVKAVTADWDNYVRSARTLIVALRAFSQREENCLYTPAIVILMQFRRNQGSGIFPDAPPMG